MVGVFSSCALIPLLKDIVLYSSDITLAVSGDFILVDSKSKDFSLKYDRRDSVSVTLDKDLYSDRTEGLCGVLNNDATG